MTAPLRSALFVPPTAPPAATARPAATAEPTAPALSDAEKTALARAFPEAPALTLRLYGPQRQATTVAPPALGTRLDLVG